MASSVQNVPVCKGNHMLKSIFFCKRCAGDYPSINPSLDRVFFCKDCSPAALMSHTHVGDRSTVAQQSFETVYQNFKDEVSFQNFMTFARFMEKNAPRHLSREEITATMNELMAKNPPIYQNAVRKGPLTLADLTSSKYRRWLVESHFWERPYANSINTQVESYVSEQFKVEPADPWANFSIEFNGNLAAAVDLSKEIQGSKNRLVDLNREKLLSELFVQITACYTNEDIEKALTEYGKVEADLAQNFAFLLKLGKLKVLELHDQGSSKMKAILKDINATTLEPREKELYYYYCAISEWDYVQDLSSSQSQLFLDSRNKKYFRLLNPKQFVDFLTKAIAISKKALYLAARGLGNMVLAKFDQAEADFTEAETLSYKNDAMNNNRLLNRLRRNLSTQRFVVDVQLQQRKTEYIMNLCRHLEKAKMYAELRRCSEELVNREPRNAAFRVCLLRALLKVKDTDAARQELSAVKDLKELSNADIEQFEKKIELLKANEQDELGNLSDAEGKYEHAAKVGQPSATYWYNYAAFLFKHREERERNDKALVAVNNALEIKQKGEYYALKYMILFLMGNLEEAKRIQDKLSHPKYANMKEYVNENI